MPQILDLSERYISILPLSCLLIRKGWFGVAKSFSNSKGNWSTPIVTSQLKDSEPLSLNSADIKEHKKISSILKVTVDFVAEVITCIKDKDKKIISGDPEKIKKIYDTWVFSRDTRSNNPNWQLIDILT